MIRTFEEEAGVKFWRDLYVNMEQLDMEQEKSFDHLIRKLKMGKRCFSVDFSSKVLVAMNHGQPAEARNKVRATLLGRDHKEQARRERVGVTEKNRH